MDDAGEEYRDEREGDERKEVEEMRIRYLRLIDFFNRLLFLLPHTQINSN